MNIVRDACCRYLLGSIVLELHPSSFEVEYARDNSLVGKRSQKIHGSADGWVSCEWKFLIRRIDVHGPGIIRAWFLRMDEGRFRIVHLCCDDLLL